MNPIKRFLQSLTATPEVMQEIAEIDAQFAYIEGCGTSREDALHMALKCAQLGLTPADIERMARISTIWTQLGFTADDIIPTAKLAYGFKAGNEPPHRRA